MYYHNNELPPQQGWICPKCGRVNAPWMPTCGCVSSQTSGTGAPYLVEISPISRDSHEIDTPQTDCEKYLDKIRPHDPHKDWVEDEPQTEREGE